MRLAVFTSQFPSRVSTFFARDVRGLIEAGIEVEIFPLYPLDPALWTYVPDLLDGRILPRDRVHHVDFSSALRGAGAGCPRAAGNFAKDALSFGLSAAAEGPGPLAKSAYALGKAWIWAGRYGGRFDHVLAYWGNYAATCAIAFQRMSDSTLPVSMFLHAGTDLYRRTASLRPKLLYVDNIITVCRFNQAFLEESHPDLRNEITAKTHVHHIGLDLASLPVPDGPRATTRLVAVGSLETAKGFDVLLRAVSLLKGRGVDVELDLVGDGPRRGALADLAVSLGIADRVHAPGWLPFEEVRKVMGRAAALVHPSIGLGDAVPTVIKEALALGTPVVASDVAGIPELLDGGSCGVLVPPRDPDRLADALVGLLRDDARRRELARAGRAFAEETFDMWRNGRTLAAVLKATRRAATRRTG